MSFPSALRPNYPQATLPMTRHLFTAAATLLALACKPAAPVESPTPPPDPPSVAEVVEWLVGEQMRGTKTSKRGTSVGIVTIPLVAKSLDEGTLAPGSCIPELVSFISVPGTTDEWLAVDATGKLLRYANHAWAPVQSKVALPPIAKLLGFPREASPARELFVSKKGDGKRLWQLSFVEDVVVGLTAVDPSVFSKRLAALERIDSRRCLERTRSCLQLAALGDDRVLGREPTLYANWEMLMELGNTGARDVRYADAKGEIVGLLISAPCDPPAMPAPTSGAAPASPTSPAKPSG